jgi:hypothetical protein
MIYKKMKILDPKENQILYGKLLLIDSSSKACGTFDAAKL